MKTAYIDIKNRIVGQDYTGRCAITKYDIYKCTDYFGLAVMESKWKPLMEVSNDGILKFKNLNVKFYGNVYLKVFNGYKWVEYMDYAARLVIEPVFVPLFKPEYKSYPTPVTFDMNAAVSDDG